MAFKYSFLFPSFYEKIQKIDIKVEHENTDIFFL